MEAGKAKRAGWRRAETMQRKLTLRTMAAVFDEWIEAVCAARKAQKMLRKVTSSEPPEPATCPLIHMSHSYTFLVWCTSNIPSRWTVVDAEAHLGRFRLIIPPPAHA